VSQTILIDTGPLVSYLVRAAEHHQWAVEQWSLFAPPMITCEAVLAEAAHLLRREHQSAESLLDLLAMGVLEVDFAVQREIPSLKQLLRKYSNLPISLADACLVRMSEFSEGSAVLTIDSHFRVYRRHGRQAIPVIMPANAQRQ
jgi:predicted nucleic acid-binding protein